MTSLYHFASQSPNNIGVSQHFVKKNSEKEHAYNQHKGRLNTNDAKDSTFHWQTIIIECLEVCNKRTVGLFVWSRDHSQSDCSSKYLNWKCVSAVFIVGIAVKTATIRELGARTSSRSWTPLSYQPLLRPNTLEQRSATQRSKVFSGGIFCCAAKTLQGFSQSKYGKAMVMT